jgi:hypothetical protein
MITVYDPAQPQPTLFAARHEWGLSHYETRLTEFGGKPALALVFRRGDEARPQVQSALWLPWTALAGVGGMTVDLFCSNSGAKLYLDCMDGDGWGLRFFLGTDQYDGWHTFRFDPFEIAATWGTCTGKRSSTDPLQPAALVVEDHEDRGSFELGLGQINAQAEPSEETPPVGEATCILNRATLELDVARGGRPLLRGFALHGMIPGAAPADFRRLTVANVNAVAHGHYQAELAAGDVRLPLEVELQQISSQVWILRYSLRIRSELQLERLDLRGLLPYRSVAGLDYAAGEDEQGRLDGQPRQDGLLAEPAMWEPLIIGRPGGEQLRIKADGPVLKSLRLLDLRTDEDIPSYAVDVTVARDETLAAGTELKFNMLFDSKA